jgi:transcriptional regulator with XRE-family HTH domain/DNA-binding CsgD family transcriptional regulator
VMADSGSNSGADADLDSAEQTDAAARERELIARLTRRRAASGLSQARVARLMRTSQSAVARLESGQHDAQLSTLTRYAEALGLSLDLVEDAGIQAGGSSSGSGAEAAKASPGGQVSVERPRHAVPPHADTRPEGQPGRNPEEGLPAVLTETPDKPDPDHVLTGRQRKVLQVIRESVQKRGYPPSMREIAEAIGLTSTSTVSHHLSTLQRKGYLGSR